MKIFDNQTHTQPNIARTLSLKTAIPVVALFISLTAHASLITANPGDNFHDAQNINGSFDLSFDVDIGDFNGSNTSRRIPHSSIDAAHMNHGYTHWYTFSLSASSTVILDIDYGADFVPTGPDYPDDITDTELFLLDNNGSILDKNDDTQNYGARPGAGGSVFHYDSFLETGVGPGDYYIAVCEFSCSASGFGISGNEFTENDGYMLQVSASNPGPVPVPGPNSLGLLATGIAALAFYRRSRRQFTAE